MSELVGLLVASAIVNNILLVQLFGVSTLVAHSNRLSPTIELALVCSITLIITTVLHFPLYHYLLAPFSLAFLNLLSVVLLSTAVSSLLALVIRSHFPLSFKQQPQLLFIAGVNSAVVATLLSSSTINLGFLEALFSSLGTAIGFSVVLIAFSALRIRLSLSSVPAAFHGGPILLITAGIAAMGFLGFAGLI